MKLPNKALYAISPEFENDAALFEWAAEIVGAGCPILQYRDKTHAAPQKMIRAKKLREITAAKNTILIINDSVLLALKSGADGVHLGRDDGSLFLARQILGETKIIGISCYASLETARRAEKMGADYVAFGAVFSSITKPNAESVALSKIALAKMALQIPVCAIGGITPQNAAEVLQSGVNFLAVSNALLENPRSTAIFFQNLWKGEKNGNESSTF